MPLKSTNTDSSIPLFIQIENLVQFAIASGELKGGDQLPSVKGLGETLDVNFNTVAKAYRDLEIMELINTKRGVGCYVAEGVQAKCSTSMRKRIVIRIHEITQEAKAAGFTKKLLHDVLSKSYASDSAPYDPTPKSVMAVAKHKK